ncbi:hypothetical protein M5K25_002627 [Dendrobium thyrsiflorum]|uniref:Uncharacterized protein n=1 Tax=Dendrobium thyrsiflorum TaxID=117978 RepID=A0ABD0VN60_DENTH
MGFDERMLLRHESDPTSLITPCLADAGIMFNISTATTTLGIFSGKSVQIAAREICQEEPEKVKSVRNQFCYWYTLKIIAKLSNNQAVILRECTPWQWYSRNS